jgi:HD-GYP domain-containing protein (c-di-GMP phosphodiesterase class II)
VEDIKVGALLHDIGKIGIDDSILNKPGKLTPQERDVILRHPQIGNDILKNVQLSTTTHAIILHHHERYDGGGYPDGTKENELPIDVYIVSAADAFDAMTSERPYCKNRTVEQAMDIIKRESGKQFHPKVVEAFLQVLTEELASRRKAK